MNVSSIIKLVWQPPCVFPRTGAVFASTNAYTVRDKPLWCLSESFVKLTDAALYNNMPNGLYLLLYLGLNIAGMRMK